MKANKQKDFDFNISPKKDNSSRFDYSINNSFNVTNLQHLDQVLTSMESQLKSIKENVELLIANCIKEK